MTNYPKIYPTVVHMLYQTAAEFNEKIAVKFEDRQLSYIQYLRCISGLARQLRNFNRGQSLRGQRVALICNNSIEMAVGLFAVHASGGQVVPLYYRRRIGPSAPISMLKITAIVLKLAFLQSNKVLPLL